MCLVEEWTQLSHLFDSLIPPFFFSLSLNQLSLTLQFTNPFSGALRPNNIRAMHMYWFLSQILIIHKVNWVYFLTPWIFIDQHTKKDTPVHFHSVSLFCHSCFYFLDGLAHWSQWPLVRKNDALWSKTTATKSGRHAIRVISFLRHRHSALV